MAGILEIPLVTDDQNVLRRVSAAARTVESLGQVVAYRTVAELAARITGQAGALAVVHIDPAPAAMLAELGRVLQHRPQLRCIVLCGAADNGLMLKAMQVGARHFMSPDAVAEELPDVLLHLMPQEGAGSFQRGPLVTLLPASGGAGGTTLSVNLANEFQLLCAGSVLLVDMDTCYGSVATYLGLKGSYGLADVLAQGQAADPQLIRSSASAFSDNFHVLLSPTSVSFHDPMALAWEHLPAALSACRRAFAFTVVDAPHLPTDVAVQLASQSSMTLIVLQMTVQDIKYARNLRSALIQSGVDSERVRLVINRFRKRSAMISFKECKRALGSNGLATIRNDFRSAIRGLNFGKPLSDLSPTSALRKDIRRLAEETANAAVEGRPTT